MNNLILSKYACKDNDAIYFKEEKKDFRTPFFRDIDRIMYTLAFARYNDKTQVFSYKENDQLNIGFSDLITPYLIEDHDDPLENLDKEYDA